MEVELIILSLIFSAFFSGIEIAYISANKLKIELLKKKGSVAGKLLASYMASPSRFLGATLMGNNIALIVLGIMMARLLEPVLFARLPYPINTEFWVVLCQTLITTFLVLITGEFLPKALFRLNPEGLLRFFILPFAAISYILTPIVWVVVTLSNFILKTLFGMEVKEDKPVFSKVDLEHFVRQIITSEEEEEELNKDIFEKALSLTDVKARECMVPRTELEAVEVTTTIDELKQKFINTKHSKMLVYEESIDNILGYVHHFDLLSKPSDIKQIIFPIKVIPETMPARELLNLFIKDQKSIAWVVDEFGGTAGIVTLEDVLEEIFGEINDEHDEEEFIEKQIAENEYIFSGRLEVDYLNEKYDLHFPEGDYETLAGFIVAHYEDIPDRGEEIIIDHYNLSILNVSDTRIELVKLKLL